MRTLTIWLSFSIAAAAAATACTEPDAPCNSPEVSDELREACGRCEVNPDCESGVCLEATGVCARPDELIHVASGGTGTDDGACTREVPCRTLAYALGQVSPSRNVIRISGRHLVVAAPISIDRPVAIDAAGAILAKPPGGPLFAIEEHAGTVTLDGMQLHGIADLGDPTITVGAGSTLRISSSFLDSVPIDVEGGSLDLLGVKATTSSQPRVQVVRCWGGAVRAREATFEHATISAVDCRLDIARSRFFEHGDGGILASRGVAVLENNLFLQAAAGADLMYLMDLAPGSAVRFNTFVSTSGRIADGLALSCSGAADVTSNIFAYGSKHPLGPTPAGCAVRYSLFDTAAAEAQIAGDGNVVADPEEIFVDRDHGDFRPGARSPAHAGAEPGLRVKEDLLGNPRGSCADIGALEAP